MNRTDSTIVAPYERWQLYNENVKTIDQKINYAANKTKQVAWFVSNCGARWGWQLKIMSKSTAGPKCYKTHFLRKIFFLKVLEINVLKFFLLTLYWKPLPPVSGFLSALFVETLYSLHVFRVFFIILLELI